MEDYRVGFFYFQRPIFLTHNMGENQMQIINKEELVKFYKDTRESFPCDTEKNIKNLVIALINDRVKTILNEIKG